VCHPTHQSISTIPERFNCFLDSWTILFRRRANEAFLTKNWAAFTRFVPCSITSRPASTQSVGSASGLEFPLRSTVSQELPDPAGQEVYSCFQRSVPVSPPACVPQQIIDNRGTWAGTCKPSAWVAELQPSNGGCLY